MSVSDKIPDKGRADGGKPGTGSEENGFYFRSYYPVHISNGSFIFKVGSGTDTSQYGLRSDCSCKIDGQPVVGNNLNGAIILKDLPDVSDTLFGRKHGLLICVDADTYYEFVKKVYGTVDNVDMTVGNRVERTGK